MRAYKSAKRIIVRACARKKIRKRKETARSEVKQRSERVKIVIELVKKRPAPDVINVLIKDSLLLSRSLVAAIQYAMEKKDNAAAGILKRKLKENKQVLKTANKLLRIVKEKKRSHQYPDN